MGIRSLQHSKANRLEIKKGVPSPNEGNNGELRLGITAKGIFLYVKYGNRWYQLGDAAISSGGQFSAQGIASQGAGTLATSIDRGNQSLNMGGNVVLSGNTISNTGSNTGVKFEDSATLAIDVANTKIGTNGYMTLTDNQLDVSSGNLDIDVAGNIIMDADGGSVTIVDTNPTGYYPSFTLQSTDAGAAGPIMSFKHDSASPAIGDDVGGIYFMGDDDGGNVSGYGSITAEIQDPTNGAEEGKISFHVLSGGGASAAGYSMVGNSGVADVNIGYGATSTTTIAGDLTVNGDTTTFSSANANDPLVAIKNTANDATGARLQFVKDKGAAGADGDDIGIIEFVGDDAAQTQTTFAKIIAEVSEADDTDEAGKLSFFVAESDGTDTALTAGLVIEGEHATDGQVDVTIGAGAASTTIIAGDLTVTGNDINFPGNGTIDPLGHLSLDVGASKEIFLNENGGTYTPSAANHAVPKHYLDANTYHFIKCGFSQGTANKVYLPIAGSDDQREDTNPSGEPEKVLFICPYNGSVEKVLARSEEACGSSVLGIHIVSDGTEMPSTTATQSVTVDMAADDTSYEFDFASAGTNTFTKGQVIMFSFDPTSTMNDISFTIVLKFDVST